MTEFVPSAGEGASEDRAEELAKELLRITQGENDPEGDSVENRINLLEHALHLETEPDRLLEAALYIDKEYFDCAIIMGEPAKPERIFGDEAWASQLKARLLAKEYGRQPLTVDFVVALHRVFLGKTHPEITKSFVDSENPRAMEYTDGKYAPFTLTNEQLEAINGNPLLQWQPEPGQSNVGAIGYVIKTAAERQQELEKICAQYNTEIDDSGYKPYTLAAQLQHRFISLHPLAKDYSGRVSRVLMNWSLDNDGMLPSIVNNFDADILSSEEEWTGVVSEGSARYRQYKERLAAGETDSAILFDLGREKSFYEQSFRHQHETPPPLMIGNRHESLAYERFLTDLRTQL